jgi:hypothetical protein
MYVYKRSEPGLWTVGFYLPNGRWEPESDHDSRELAAARVAMLNGGHPAGAEDTEDAEVARRILKRVLVTLGLHGAFTEDALIAKVAAIAKTDGRPELLAAARLAMDAIGGTRDDFGLKIELEKAYLALRAAIAKAEGTS